MEGGVLPRRTWRRHGGRHRHRDRLRAGAALGAARAVRDPAPVRRRRRSPVRARAPRPADGGVAGHARAPAAHARAGRHARAGVADELSTVDTDAMVARRGGPGVPSLQAFEPNDRRSYRLYAAPEELGVPALFHTGQSGIGAGLPGGRGIELRYSDPMLIDDVAADFGGPTVALAHPSVPWHRRGSGGRLGAWRGARRRAPCVARRTADGGRRAARRGAQPRPAPGHAARAGQSFRRCSRSCLRAASRRFQASRASGLWPWTAPSTCAGPKILNIHSCQRLRSGCSGDGSLLTSPLCHVARRGPRPGPPVRPPRAACRGSVPRGRGGCVPDRRGCARAAARRHHRRRSATPPAAARAARGATPARSRATARTCGRSSPGAASGGRASARRPGRSPRRTPTRTPGHAPAPRGTCAPAAGSPRPGFLRVPPPRPARRGAGRSRPRSTRGSTPPCR
ncbi:MAG TPA: amidohydrolase family protein [Mycobacteriales bacterium]|nr:amidohydrolase family protein [Mycobacteriales bacterium]